MKKINFKNEELYLKIGIYPNNRIAIICETEEDEYCDITINLPNCSIESVNHCYIDSFTKEIGLEECLIKNGIIKNILDVESYNMGKYDLVELDMDKLKEYDFEGFDYYIEKSTLESLEI